MVKLRCAEVSHSILYAWYPFNGFYWEYKLARIVITSVTSVKLSGLRMFLPILVLVVLQISLSQCCEIYDLIGGPEDGTIFAAFFLFGNVTGIETRLLHSQRSDCLNSKLWFNGETNSQNPQHTYWVIMDLIKPEKKPKIFSELGAAALHNNYSDIPDLLTSCDINARQSSQLSLVEIQWCFALIGQDSRWFRVLLCQPSYAIKNKLKAPKTPSGGISCLLLGHKGTYYKSLLCMEATLLS